MDRDLRWFAMSVGMQISNIGSEVNRAIKWKNQNDTRKMMTSYEKALDLLDLTKQDPKNLHHLAELDFCIEELKDYFVGDNIYNTTEQMLHKYYDAFL